MSFLGIVLQVTYRLRRHLWAGWPLSRWLGLLLAAGALLALFYEWPNYWPAALLGGLLLLHVLVLVWAGRRRYVDFKAEPQAGTLLQNVPSPPPLRAEELVRLRASGRFSVEGRDQHYMDVEADFETMETREHIVLGRVHPSRFLLLGRWPAWEMGWWYIFFEPSMILELKIGHLCFGSQPRLTLRVVYAPDEDTQRTVYLTFDDISTLRRVWDDLVRGVPANVVT